MPSDRVNLFLIHVRKLVSTAFDGVGPKYGAVLQGVSDMGYAFEFEPDTAAFEGPPCASARSLRALVDQCLAAFAAGDNNALFDLGVVFSTGCHGAPRDLVEAHKWFNIAAASGNPEAATSRAEIAAEMNAREIADAQRRARAEMGGRFRRAA